MGDYVSLGGYSTRVNYPYKMPILDGFVDSSYINDSAPSISKDLGNDNYLQLWVDYPSNCKHLSDFADCEDYYQYRLSFINDEIGIHDGLLNTHDFNQLCDFINGFLLGYNLKKGV